MSTPCGWANPPPRSPTSGLRTYAAGQFADAERMYVRQVVLDPNNASAYRNLGDVYLALRRVPQARQHYSKAIDLAERTLAINPRDAKLISIVAVCEVELGRTDAALRHAAEAATLAPADNDVLLNGATVHLRAGRQEDAQRLLARAIAAGYPAEYAKRDPKVNALVDGGTR